MIEIISHRGIWYDKEDRNTLSSFEKSLELGFGIETDIRDHEGEIVISHDPPKQSKNLVTFDEFLFLYQSSKVKPNLALNIKADGLADMLKKKLDQYRVLNYFVFDMSVPDCLNYRKQELIYYTRQSEIEGNPYLYEDSCGIWLDCFYKDWIDKETILFHYRNQKNMCIVSPELHGRPYKEAWQTYKDIMKSNPKIEISICTDYPTEAKEYFAEN